ncbi:MAG: hypothetical protein H0Z32_03375 [Bacillaceae bacterium]|nr:hypothetical protein [Bacillaceae bacterium]
MVQKWLSVLFFSVVLSVGMITETAAKTDFSEEATLFKDSFVEQNRLTAKQAIPVISRIKHVQLKNNQLKIVGTVDRKPFSISGNIKGEKITRATDSSGNFTPLSIYVFNNEIELYLEKNKRQIIRIRFKNTLNTNQLFFNRYWYNDYINVLPENVSSYQVRTQAYNTSYDEVYERSFYIYGDKWTETLTVTHYYNWPSSTDGNGSYWFVTAELTNNQTTIDYYDPNKSTITVNGSSLEVAGAKAAFGTDEGEYMKHAVVDFTGTKYTSGPIVTLEYGLSLPNSPAGIKFNWPESKHINDGDDNRFSFTYDGDEKVQGYVVKWDPYEYHLEDVGDFFEVASWIMTDETYAEEGRKRLKTEWQYEIVSDGVNHGTAAPVYNEIGGFRNTLYYDLKFY